MVPFFPKTISVRAIVVYLIALVIVSLAYSSFAMSFGYIALGCIWVIGFFTLLQLSTSSWRGIPEKRFVERVFIVALALRIVWVVFSYFYYIEATGMPFEFDSADAIGYHLDAEWLAGESFSTIRQYLISVFMISDSGYPLYLIVLYKLFGPSIIIARIIKAFLSAFTCVLVYKLASRVCGESVGRIAGLMMVFMPNLIIYCGYHLKETEMLFLEIAFLERLDHLFRSKRYRFWDILLPTLLGGSLFLFRTVLGAVAILVFAAGAILSNYSNMKRKGKRAVIIGWGILCLAANALNRRFSATDGLNMRPVQ